ncbi:hypothetical protein CCMSSC00406_0006027 [Pleurotus cornucopiae]|uniref:Uncharacterized protein n=1 Tax=Pleurotus cornucopiae TaxID=5321 RepID=A0ACB7IRG5_PLECO|nr:hypothetical protein CCMSSC00406_0006027 [Pleurotus cornucopiae]
MLKWDCRIVDQWPVLREIVATDLVEHWSPGYDISLMRWKGQGKIKVEVEGKEEDGESRKRKLYPATSRGHLSSSIYDASTPSLLHPSENAITAAAQRNSGFKAGSISHKAALTLANDTIRDGIYIVVQSPSLNPSINTADAAFEASEFNTQAYQAQQSRTLQEAERLYLLAIELKERSSGPNSMTVVTSRGMLCEVYLKMGKIEEADYNLKEAMAVMNESGTLSFNAAVTRENLAQLAEMKGEMGEAKALRLGGASNTMACANSECTRQGLRIDVLKQCSNCKSVYYCSETCQRIDWRDRHKKYCSTPTQ